MGTKKTRVRFAPSPAGLLHVGNAKSWMNEIKAATYVKGKDLLHPVRIALTGAHLGTEFDKLLPLIEARAMLNLGIPSVRERVERIVEG